MKIDPVNTPLILGSLFIVYLFLRGPVNRCLAKQKEKKEYDELSKCGAIDIIEQALQVHRTRKASEGPYFSGHAYHVRKAHAEQNMIQHEPGQIIHGTVYEERIEGFVQYGILTMTVKSPEIRASLEQALKHVVNRESFTRYGYRLKLKFQ